MTKTLEELEAESTGILVKELAAPRTLLNTAANLFGKATMSLRAEDLDKKNSATRVAVLLAIRLANDSRCVSLLAKMGYGIQSASIAASIYEIAYTIAYIGADNTLAEKWLAHEEVLNTPFAGIGILKLTEEGLRKLNVPSPEKQVLNAYQIYSQLCMVKHGNPLIQGQNGFRITQEIVFPKNGPDTADHAVRMSWFALENSVAHTLCATQSFLMNHVPLDKREQFTAEFNFISQECLKLRDQAIKRWGNKDPNPGKWRK